MCRTPREVDLKSISNNNIKLLNNIIEIIDNNIKVNLYREFKDISINLDNINEFKKTKSFYKQTIKRLLNTIERYSMKERLLLEDIEKGQRLVEMKKAATVQSPNYGFEASFNDGYRPNTYEIKLHAIEEELEKQDQRIKKYDDYVKQHEEEKDLLTKFIELSPNTPGVEGLIRHFFNGESYESISKKLKYSNIKTMSYRALDDVAMILMFSL